jgi:branched-chain amino acid aminotransferase
MKAYRGKDGKIRLFRPDLNMKRMLTSAERSVLPVRMTVEIHHCISDLFRSRHSMEMNY